MIIVWLPLEQAHNHLSNSNKTSGEQPLSLSMEMFSCLSAAALTQPMDLCNCLLKCIPHGVLIMHQET